MNGIFFDQYTVHRVHFDHLGPRDERLEHELRGCTGLGDFTVSNPRCPPLPPQHVFLPLHPRCVLFLACQPGGAPQLAPRPPLEGNY